jgi:SAM-dependent methyltransferase
MATSHSAGPTVATVQRRRLVAEAMQRVPEPELMEEVAQVQAYAMADFAAGDQAVVERLVQLAATAGVALASPEALLVDLGCGPGNISLRLSSRFPAARVVGIDGSAAMLRVAEERRCGLGAAADRLQFACHTLPSAALEQGELAGACTALVSNSLLHHLHQPAVLWQAVRTLAAPGAFLYLKDLRRPVSPAAAEALLERHLPEAPAVLQRDYLASLHAAFTAAEVEGQLAAADLPQLVVAELDDRYLEVWGRL